MGKWTHVLKDPLCPLADTEEGAAECLFGLARKTFLRDGYHSSIAFLLRERRLVAIRGVSTKTRSRKRIAQRRLGPLVAKLEADAVVSISEAWLGVTTEFTGKESTSMMPHRAEVLSLMLVSKNLDATMFTAPIYRFESELTLGETIKQPLLAPVMFHAVYKAWGLEVPESWERDVKHADGAIAVRLEGGVKPN